MYVYKLVKVVSTAHYYIHWIIPIIIRNNFSPSLSSILYVLSLDPFNFQLDHDIYIHGYYTVNLENFVVKILL